ncbi:hypothetical protein CONLIGDRAFT_687005 [Coniochaeta ligniaria NRRL 30616]|uniref:C2H2-type domain-containing protein n=1 Tax=Coniochaeta ligniaria NRRL 30616 TaxID=1408157 RepID=A0A1J7IP71_9PEZI|nr:hypothetical protein CONLIGDRAFT_687005 [Coniochaeta ligniaria NRRL 30616]
MDCHLQSASTSVGQQEEPGIEEGFEVAQAVTFPGNNPGQATEGLFLDPKPMDTRGLASVEREVKGSLSPEVLRVVSTDGYAESCSTASSCSVDSSGRNSPVSSCTATSNFYFYLEAQEEVAVDGEDVSELRNFVKDLRGRPPLTRGFSLDADKTTGSRSKSLSDKSPMPKHLLPLREKSPRHTHYTFPLHSASGWSKPNGPAHPASAPVSAPESRRGSTNTGQSSRPKSRLSVTEPTYRELGTVPNDKPDQSSGTMVPETSMGNASDAAEELLGTVTAGISKSVTSNLICESSTPPRRRPGQKQTEDICELILKQAFNVDLQDLTFATDALDSVAHCLEELSSVVYNSRSLELPIREVPSGDYNSVWSEGPSQSGQEGRGKKRANSYDSQSGKQPDEEDQDDPQSGGEGGSPARSKKIKVEPPDTRFPCPYRKRNPLKFNIRDYNTCATTYFSDFTNLKRHIKLYHRCQPRLPNVCFRCGVDQGSRDRLMTHLQLPPDRMCLVQNEAQSSDPEEGITQEVEELLNERKSTVRINTWPGLWRALFGSDDDVLPSDFVPPVEWDEVKHEFEGTRDILKNRVQLESMTIKELRPEAQAYVAAHMDHTCWDYINYVLSASQLQADYSSEKHHKRRRSRRLSAAVQSSSGHSLLPPVTQRLILPKPVQRSSDGGLPIGSDIADVGSNGSSLSSSWETANSNISSSNLRMTSSSTSLTTPGEPGSITERKPLFMYPLATDLPPADMPVAGFFASYMGAVGVDEYALSEDLCGLFDDNGHNDEQDQHGGNFNVYGGSNTQFDLGYRATGHDAPP